MLRRILAIASFMLVLPVSVAAVFTLVTFPEAVGITMRYPEALLLWGARFLFPFTGALAAACSGYHLLRGSQPGSAFRRVLHLSNGIFVPMAGILGAFIWGMALAYPNPRSSGSQLWSLVPFSPILGIIALYLVLLFWRGAVTDPSSAPPTP